MFKLLSRDDVLSDQQFRTLQSLLTQISDNLSHIGTSLAQLVKIQQARLEVEKKMNIDLSVLKSILDAANNALLAETTAMSTVQAQTEQIANLLSQVGPVPPDVQASIDSFLANAAAVNPPENPVPVPEPTPEPTNPNA